MEEQQATLQTAVAQLEQQGQALAKECDLLEEQHKSLEAESGRQARWSSPRGECQQSEC